MAPTEVPRSDGQDGGDDVPDARRPWWWPPEPGTEEPQPVESPAAEPAPEAGVPEGPAAEARESDDSVPEAAPSEPMAAAPPTDADSPPPPVLETRADAASGDADLGGAPPSNGRVVATAPVHKPPPLEAVSPPIEDEQPPVEEESPPVEAEPPPAEEGSPTDENPPIEPLPDDPIEQPGPKDAEPVTSPARPETRTAVVEEPPVRSRDRFLPRSVLGITALALAFAVGAAFSGAILYSYYEYKKDTTERRVASFVEGFDKRFDTALATIEAESNNARAEIQKELEPLRKTRAEGETLENLVKKVEPSTFFVSTLDESGQPSVGTAFAVASDRQQTLVLTSYATVKAATRQPGPAVRVRKGNTEIRSSLWTWDEGRDLALITLSRGDVPTLAFAPEQVRPGERVFAMSALGGAGGSITQGFVADVSSSGISHDAAVGQAFQGGPLVNSNGDVLAVASRSYAPLGFTSDQVFFAPFVRSACERVLRCSGGAPGAGDRGAPARR